MTAGDTFESTLNPATLNTRFRYGILPYLLNYLSASPKNLITG